MKPFSGWDEWGEPKGEAERNDHADVMQCPQLSLPGSSSEMGSHKDLYEGWLVFGMHFMGLHLSTELFSPFWGRNRFCHVLQVLPGFSTLQQMLCSQAFLCTLNRSEIFRTLTGTRHTLGVVWK